MQTSRQPPRQAPSQTKSETLCPKMETRAVIRVGGRAGRVGAESSKQKSHAQGAPRFNSWPRVKQRKQAATKSQDVPLLCSQGWATEHWAVYKDEKEVLLEPATVAFSILTHDPLLAFGRMFFTIFHHSPFGFVSISCAGHGPSCCRIRGFVFCCHGCALQHKSLALLAVIFLASGWKQSLLEIANRFGASFMSFLWSNAVSPVADPLP